MVHLNLPDFRRERDYEKAYAGDDSNVERGRPASEPDERGRARVRRTPRGAKRVAAWIAGSTPSLTRRVHPLRGMRGRCPELCLRLVSCDRLAGNGELAALLVGALRRGGPFRAGGRSSRTRRMHSLRIALNAARSGRSPWSRCCFTDQWAGV